MTPFQWCLIVLLSLALLFGIPFLTAFLYTAVKQTLSATLDNLNAATKQCVEWQERALEVERSNTALVVQKAKVDLELVQARECIVKMSQNNCDRMEEDFDESDDDDDEPPADTRSQFQKWFDPDPKGN